MGMGGWAHILLVGASIVTNAIREEIITANLRDLEEELGKDPILLDNLVEKLSIFVEQDCKKASAELNTCIDLLIEGYRNDKQQWCYLLSSETNIGRLCSEVLSRYLRKFSSSRLDGRLAVLDPIFVPHLGKPERFNDGLANLFEKIVEIISYHKRVGDVAFVHATGGYKPETAIAILAANSPGAGAPTFYIHEHLNQLIRIPALPIAFRRWKKFSDMMSTLLKVEKTSKEKYTRMYGRRVVEEAVRLGWIVEEDGFIRLTSFGKLLWGKMKMK